MRHHHVCAGPPPLPAAGSWPGERPAYCWILTLQLGMGKQTRRDTPQMQLLLPLLLLPPVGMPECMPGVPATSRSFPALVGLARLLLCPAACSRVAALSAWLGRLGPGCLSSLAPLAALAWPAPLQRLVASNLRLASCLPLCFLPLCFLPVVVRRQVARAAAAGSHTRSAYKRQAMSHMLHGACSLHICRHHT